MILTRNKTFNPNINVCVLGSSSSGNCTIIYNNNAVFMIDCGLPVKKVKKEFEVLNLSIENISACFITHAHSDHSNSAMFNEFNRNSTPVICCKSTLIELQGRLNGLQKCIESDLVKVFFIDKGEIADTCINNFYFQPFIVKHDCPGGCFGFKIHNQGIKITVATDFGAPQQVVIENFYNSDMIILESNYDEEMLETSGRDIELIERIQRSHVSNKITANMLVDIHQKSNNKFTSVILTHLSPECNQHRKALTTVKKAFDKNNIRAKVITAYKDIAHKPITITMTDDVPF